MGKLYIVGTPIGNLEDLSFRAKRILGEVKVVACEDTRLTRRLLDHYQLATPMIALHHHSDKQTIARFLDRVTGGDDAALVADAGMPGIADPGGRVVEAALKRGITMEVVPGPSALTAAAARSGLPTDRFLFLGFLPHKKGRETLFRRIAGTEETVILYESPHRLLKTLESLMVHCTNRLVMVARELTKVHESAVRGTPAEVLKHFQDHPDQVRGEIVIIIGPQQKMSSRA